MSPGPRCRSAHSSLSRGHATCIRCGTQLPGSLLALDSPRIFIQADVKAFHFLSRDHSAPSDLGCPGSFPPTFTPFSLASSLFSLLPWVFAPRYPVSI